MGKLGQSRAMGTVGSPRASEGRLAPSVTDRDIFIICSHNNASTLSIQHPKPCVCVRVCMCV